MVQQVQSNGVLIMKIFKDEMAVNLMRNVCKMDELSVTPIPIVLASHGSQTIWIKQWRCVNLTKWVPKLMAGVQLWNKVLTLQSDIKIFVLLVTFLILLRTHCYAKTWNFRDQKEQDCTNTSSAKLIISF